MPRVTLTIEVELSHVTGRFASKEALAEAIVEELSGVDPGTIYTDDDAEYNVDDWSVSPA